MSRSARSKGSLRGGRLLSLLLRRPKREGIGSNMEKEDSNKIMMRKDDDNVVIIM